MIIVTDLCIRCQSDLKGLLPGHSMKFQLPRYFDGDGATIMVVTNFFVVMVVVMMLVVMEKGITMIMILIYFPEGGGLNRLQWFSYSQSFAASNKVYISFYISQLCCI